MTILIWVLLIISAVFVIPIIAFLVMKWGSVGFYRGKEESRRRVDVTTMSDKKRKYEKF